MEDPRRAAEIVLSTGSITIPITALLTGVTMMQWGNYISNTPEDTTLLKALATAVTFFNVFQFAFDLVLLEVQMTNSLISAASVLVPHWITTVETFATLVSMVIVQYYFSTVVQKLTSNRIWSSVSTFLMCTTVAGGIGSIWALADILKGGDKIVVLTGSKLGLYCMWLGSSAVSIPPATFDVVVSIILCSTFFSSRRNSEFGATNDVLTFLLVSTLQTFSLSAVTALVAMILAILQSVLSGLAVVRCVVATGVCVKIFCRANALSFLYTLNRRAVLRANLEHSTHSSKKATEFPIDPRQNLSGRRSVADGVQVRMEVVTRLDDARNLKEGFREDVKGPWGQASG